MAISWNGATGEDVNALSEPIIEHGHLRCAALQVSPQERSTQQAFQGKLPAAQVGPIPAGRHILICKNYDITPYLRMGYI